MLNGKKLVIIMGAGRSGTTWLQAMLDSCSSVVTMSELRVLAYTGQWMARWQLHDERPYATGLPLLWTREEMLDEMRTLAEKTYARLVQHHPDATIILDKTPRYVYQHDHIRTLFPETHFIHVIRDGRDVTASTLAAAQDWGAHWAPHKARNAARQWVKDVVAGREAQSYTDYYTEVRYEELLANDTKALQRVFTAMGINKSHDEIQAIYKAHTLEKMRANYTIPDNDERSQKAETGIFKMPKSFYRQGQAMGWQTDLTPSQKYAVFQEAQDLLLSLGYATSDTWWRTEPLQDTFVKSKYAVMKLRHRWHAIRKSLFQVI